MARFAKTLIVLGAIAVLLAGLSAFAQQNPKRLILKDGSYQSATQWQVNGNRVRYYSAERYTWEELPKDLVDWPATEKYNKDRDASRTEEVKEAAKLGEPDSAEPPMVAPGLYLPDDGGIFLMDTYHNQPQLIELTQESGELNKHMGRNILRAAINPLALSSKQSIELKGRHAVTQSHTLQPSIYVSIDSSAGDAAQKPNTNAAAALQNAEASKGRPGQQPAPSTTSTTPAQDHYGIVRMEQKKDARVVGNLNIAIYGKVSQKQNWIKVTSTPAGGGWVRITPTEPLTPGEYAVVEMLDKGQINLYVWDFGVDPNAPANAHAWSARAPAQGPGTGQAPGVAKRPPQ